MFLSYSDGTTQSPTAAPTACQQEKLDIDLNIRTDQWGYETSWTLEETGSGAVVASDQGLSSRTQYNYSYELCSAQCYRFTILDAYGDGIYESHDGYYNLSINGDVVATSTDNTGGNFGDGESFEFCGDDYVSPPDSPTSSPTQNPTDTLSSWKLIIH